MKTSPRPSLSVALLLATLLAPVTAAAEPHGGCPPGLAKKSPACVPPGHARAEPYYRDYDDHERRHDAPHYRTPYYRTGDRIDRDYVVIRDPHRYRLDPGDYVIAGNYVYRVDPQTRKVLNLIGAVIDLTN